MKLHGELARLRRLWRPFVINNYLKNNEERKLHLGCGSKIVPGWLNVDKFSRTTDTYLNAYARFPFEDKLFSKIFSEHMIEHIRIDKVRHFLTEVHRTMKPGGVFRVTCPDLEIFIDKYRANDEEFFKHRLSMIDNMRKRKPEVTWVARTKGGAIMIDTVRNFYHHRWMYDFETLESCLKEVGFNTVLKQSCEHSIDPELANMDSPNRSKITLYIDAVKAE